MNLKELSNEHKIELLKALEQTKNLGCPTEEYRVPEHTNCFYCNECWRYALLNNMNLLDKSKGED